MRPLLKPEHFQRMPQSSLVGARPTLFEAASAELVRFQFQLNVRGRGLNAQKAELSEFLRLTAGWTAALKKSCEEKAFQKWTQSASISLFLEISFNCRRLIHERLADVCENGNDEREANELAVLTRRVARRLREVADEVLQIFLSADPGYLLASSSRNTQVLCGSALEVQSVTGKKIKIRSGDVLLSRAGAFISAGIARASEEVSAYSHVAIVFIDSEKPVEIDLEDAFLDPRVCVVEADMRVGARVRTFREYAGERFARVALLRAKGDEFTAHRAALYAARLVKDHAAQKMKMAGRKKTSVNDNIPYDFSLDLSDSSSLFCSQLLQIAYGAVNVSLPRFPSKIRNTCLSKFAGMKSPVTFVPADCEVDPHLTMLAEWRDLSQLRDVCLKDAAFDRIYAEMAEGRLTIQIARTDRLLAYSKWLVRKLDLAFERYFPKHVRPESLALSFAVNRLGSRILRESLGQNADPEAAPRKIKNPGLSIPGF